MSMCDINIIICIGTDIGTDIGTLKNDQAKKNVHHYLYTVFFIIYKFHSRVDDFSNCFDTFEKQC